MGAAIRHFLNKTRTPRESIFIESKIGPGGLAWPLGYNESLAQAQGILANYSGPDGAAEIGSVDLLLVHWPVGVL